VYTVDRHRRDGGDSFAVAEHSARSVLPSNSVSTCASTTVTLATSDRRDEAAIEIIVSESSSTAVMRHPVSLSVQCTW
jgi:hypothetical protein